MWAKYDVAKLLDRKSAGVYAKWTVWLWPTFQGQRVSCAKYDKTMCNVWLNEQMNKPNYCCAASTNVLKYVL